MLQIPRPLRGSLSHAAPANPHLQISARHSTKESDDWKLLVFVIFGINGIHAIAMESFATPYSVIFHDGERDHDKGHIGVHSVLTFKRFQALLSQKIGLPANQLSAVFVCRRTAKDTDKRQKLPINDNTNFNIILNQHNPIWEKDCHFLVCLKKSKKERKGTRRRTAEAENGDDEESVSPRGDLFPQDEHPISEGATDVKSVQQASLPGTQERQPSGQSCPHSENPEIQTPSSTASSEGKSGDKKILLRREQTSHCNSRFSRQNAGQVEQVGPISSGSPLVESSWIQDTSPQQTDVWNMDKSWGQSQPSDARLMHESDERLVVGPISHVQARTTEGLQERFNDAVPSRASILLQRNGIHLFSGPVASAPLFSPVSTSWSLVYPPPAAGILLSRVPSGIPGLASKTSAALNLQQAQAHYLNVQTRHPDQMHLTPQALSKMRGVVRGLAASEGGNQKLSGICRYCCTFRERNINPAPFHLCVHDRVTNGFRGPSPAGPIERPVERLEVA